LKGGEVKLLFRKWPQVLGVLQGLKCSVAGWETFRVEKEGEGGNRGNRNVGPRC